MIQINMCKRHAQSNDSKWLTSSEIWQRCIRKQNLLKYIDIYIYMIYTKMISQFELFPSLTAARNKQTLDLMFNDLLGVHAEHTMDELILLGGLHHPAAMQPQRAQNRQHIHIGVRAQLLNAIQDGEKATGAPDASATMYNQSGLTLIQIIIGIRVDCVFLKVQILEDVDGEAQNLRWVGHLVILPIGIPIMPHQSTLLCFQIDNAQDTHADIAEHLQRDEVNMIVTMLHFVEFFITHNFFLLGIHAACVCARAAKLMIVVRRR